MFPAGLMTDDAGAEGWSRLRRLLGESAVRCALCKRAWLVPGLGRVERYVCRECGAAGSGKSVKEARR